MVTHERAVASLGGLLPLLGSPPGPNTHSHPTHRGGIHAPSIRQATIKPENRIACRSGTHARTHLKHGTRTCTHTRTWLVGGQRLKEFVGVSVLVVVVVRMCWDHPSVGSYSDRYRRIVGHQDYQHYNHRQPSSSPSTPSIPPSAPSSFTT